MSSSTAPRSILVVCLGNICRSPYAEGLFRERLGSRADVESAGIIATAGRPATPEMIAVASENEIDLSGHRARHVRDLELSDYDRIVALTSEIGDALVHDFAVDPQRLIRLEVDDPYGSTIEQYRRCAEEIDRAVSRLAADW